MPQTEKAARFKELHKKGEPVILYNIWDAGGAKALAGAGARAIATSSWSMAAAHGYDDGENIPLDFVLTIVKRIVDTIDLPVTVDFEGGYGVEPDEVATNVRQIIRAGAIGINLEDRILHGQGLFAIEVQAGRIKAIKTMAQDEGFPIFVNARTDLFLGKDSQTHPGFMAEAIEREAAYAEAGADGYFVPGLTRADLVTGIVDAATLPVNVMMPGNGFSVEQMAGLGISRVSFGPSPYINAEADLVRRFRAL